MPAVSAAPWPELTDPERRVLLELLLRGADSRVRVAEALGLSRASLTRTTRGLLEVGLVREGELQAHGGRGRPAETLELVPESAHFLGAKLTGDALYLVLTDLSARIVNEVTAPLISTDVASVVGQIRQSAATLTRASAPAVAIGVGLAGDVELAGVESVLRRSNFLGWDGVPLRRLVQEAVGLPTTVANDVHALTMAHHWFGGLSHHRSLVVYGLGAGIGSGIVARGALASGAHGRAGRIGHSRIGGAGVACLNGHIDCVHSFVTMRAIESNAGRDQGEYATVVRAAHAGDRAALEAFGRAAFALGAIIAESVNTLDPEVVAVMGEGLDMLDLAPEMLQRGLAEHLEQTDPADVRIERPGFHFDLYARGAAVAAMRELLEAR